MQVKEIIPFSGNPLDRASNLRRDEAWLERQLGATESRFLAFWRLNPLTREEPPIELYWLDRDVCNHLEFGAEPLLLGLRDGVAHYAVDLSSHADPLTTLGLQDGRASFADARRIAVDIPAAEAGIVAQARAMLEWHARHRFCGSCGAPTSACAGGLMRKCTSCSAEHFASPHPVVIMVVWRGDRCLLGRGRGWGVERYSALAGFMDQGETIEEAVAREVMEEVGLEVDEVTYHSSQPWPFPMSLMMGCFAHVTGEETTVDQEELDGARWFDREEIRRALADPGSVDFGIPGRIAIAHHIIKAWSEQS